MDNFDHEAAFTEGWRLVINEPKFRGWPPTAHIARIHSRSAARFDFSTDDDAIEYVAVEALLGSPLHQQAIFLTRRYNGVLRHGSNSAELSASLQAGTGNLRGCNFAQFECEYDNEFPKNQDNISTRRTP